MGKHKVGGHMKNSYEVNLEDVLFRRAKETDNMRDIATLIYQTDPYIYPFWFNNDVEKAKDFLEDKIKMPGFVFNYDNIYVAYDKKTDKIVGIIVAIDPSLNLEFDYKPYEEINSNYEFTINNYIKGCIEEVKKGDFLYQSKNKIFHGQSPYISLDDFEKVINHI